MPSFLAGWRGPALVCTWFVLVGALFGLSMPVLEASDELHHYPVIEYLVAGNGLPVQPAGPDDRWKQEGSQPPLYYLAGAAVTALIPQADGLDRLWVPNPHARAGEPGFPDNKAMFAHDPAQTGLTNGALLAAGIVRVLTLALGAAALLAAWALVRELAPRPPWFALAVMAVMASIPTWLFVSASVNNDTPTVFLGTLAMLLSARLVTRGSTPRQVLLLGVVLGLAALTKLSGLVFAVPAALAVLAAHWLAGLRGGALLRALARDGLLLAAPIAVIAGWWYVRNVVLYGDPTGLAGMFTVIERRESFGPADLLVEFQGFRISFWGLFGGSSVILPDGIYPWLDRLTLLAGLGLGIVAIRRLLAWRCGRRTADRTRRLVAGALVLLATALVLVALVRWTSMTPASFGRLAFPALAPLVMLFVAGLVLWAPRRAQPVLASVLVAGFAGLALATPFLALRPAYATPPVVPSPASIPADAIPLGYRVDGLGELLAWRPDAPALVPGQPFPVTLWWRPAGPTETPWSVVINGFGAGGVQVAQRDSWPGGGNLATSLWPSRTAEGPVLVDTHWIPAFPARPDQGPDGIVLTVGVYDPVTGDGATVRDPDGRPLVPAVLGRVRGEGVVPGPVVGVPLDAAFGPVFLAGLAAPVSRDGDGGLVVPLVWEPRTSPGDGLTRFVHVLDPTGSIVAQADGLPTGGQFPSRLWRADDRILDTVRVPLLPGVDGPLRVVTGLVRPGGARLEATGNDALPGDVALVATLP